MNRKETDGITTDVWDEDGAERPRLSQAVMDWSRQFGSELTTLEEIVGHKWHYKL